MDIGHIENKIEYQNLFKQNKLHFLQSYEWAELKSHYGWQTQKLRLGDKPISLLVKTLPIFKFKVGYIARPDLSTEELTELTTVVKGIVDLLIIDPNWQKKEIALPGEFKRGKQIQPQYTNIVRFTGKTKEDIWTGMDGKYRRNIKKSEREGVQVKSTNQFDNEALDKFYKVMLSVSLNTDYVLVNKAYFQMLFQLLVATNSAEIFWAESNNKVVGAYLVTYDEIGAYEIYGGVTPEGRDVEAGYLLKWEAIKKALGRGKEFYDHWGVSPFILNGEEVEYDTGHQLYQISKFKHKFGGQAVAFEDQLVYVFNPIAYFFYNFGDTVKGIILKIRKLLNL